MLMQRLLDGLTHSSLQEHHRHTQRLPYPLLFKSQSAGVILDRQMQMSVA